jgi:hypothetical protein
MKPVWNALVRTKTIVALANPKWIVRWEECVIAKRHIILTN